MNKKNIGQKKNEVSWPPGALMRLFVQLKRANFRVLRSVLPGIIYLVTVFAFPKVPGVKKLGVYVL